MPIYFSQPSFDLISLYGISILLTYGKSHPGNIQSIFSVYQNQTRICKGFSSLIGVTKFCPFSQPIFLVHILSSRYELFPGTCYKIIR